MADVATVERGLTDTNVMNQEHAAGYLMENYPGLLFIQQLPQVKEFLYRVYNDGKVEITVSNNDFTGHYMLRKTEESDFTPFWSIAEAAERGGYLVAESIELTGPSGESLDIMPPLTREGISLFIDGLCPQLDVFKTDPERINSIDEDIRGEVTDGVYNAFGTSARPSLHRGYILNALPVNRESLFSLAHEIGHQQRKSFENREKTTDILNDPLIPKEKRDHMFQSLSYQDERYASAYGLRYVRGLYDRLGIQTNLRETVPQMAHIALYVKQSFFKEASFVPDFKVKPAPVPQGEQQAREYRIAAAIKALVPNL